jgi:hypothetical protein
MTRGIVRDGRHRLIIVSRREREILKSILHSADHWPPTTAVMLDRRGDDRRVLRQQVVIERRQRQRRREPEPIWYTYRLMVVRMDDLPAQAVVLSPPAPSEGDW